MAKQLVLLEVERRSSRPARRPVARRRLAGEWQLDEQTIAIGRRGLAEARRALRSTSSQAA